MENKDFFIPQWYQGNSVSRETMDKLQRYHSLLLKWQRAINLVGSNTLDNAWERHFMDSLQIVPYLENKKAQTLVDMGSGGGFPALVIAIACPDVTVHLIESDTRKAQFLKTIIRECSLNNAIVHNDMIDNVKGVMATVVTARALAGVDKLLDWAEKFLDGTNPETKAIFLKGISWQSEWDGIKSDYSHWRITPHQSKTDAQAAILVFTQRKNDDNKKDSTL